MKISIWHATVILTILAACGGKETKDMPAPAVDTTETPSATAPDTNILATSEDGFDMVFVKGGTFMMGCTDKFDEDKDKPAHRVTLSDFYIGRHEVTQGLWVSLMESNPSQHTGDDSLPVEVVSWNDAKKFIRKLNEKTGKKYRLPTSAEWEYAARGGNRSGGYRYSGSDTLDNVAWYSEDYSNVGWCNNDLGNCKTHPVGAKHANELGIYDMSGNVWEWVNDWYGEYDSSDRTNPLGPPDGDSRVNRGGAMNTGGWGCRVCGRDHNPPGWRSGIIGFRLALSADGTALEEDTVTLEEGDAAAEKDTSAVEEESIGDNDVLPSGVNVAYEYTGRIKAVYKSNWGYREMKRTDIPKNGILTGLFYENDAYYLKREKIVLKDEEDNGCGGGPTVALLSKAEFLFLNFTGYNKNKIPAVHLAKDGKAAPPNKKITFDFGNRQYELTAFGETEKGDDSYVTNYSLVYSIKGAAGKQVIVNIPHIRYTYVRLLFIGDLDGDGEPDIILDAPGDYEELNIMVFLSSTAKKGEYLRLEALLNAQFDC